MAAAFEITAHTADFGISGRAGSLPELFETMALGLFSLIGDLEGIEPLVRRQVILEDGDPADLLHAWLREINGLHHLHGEIYSSFEVRLEGPRLSGSVAGEAMDPERHRLHHEVKGITWHGFTLREDAGGFLAKVLVDT